MFYYVWLFCKYIYIHIYIYQFVYIYIYTGNICISICTYNVFLFIKVPLDWCPCHTVVCVYTYLLYTVFLSMCIHFNLFCIHIYIYSYSSNHHWKSTLAGVASSFRCWDRAIRLRWGDSARPAGVLEAHRTIRTSCLMGQLPYLVGGFNPSSPNTALKVDYGS